MANCGEDHDCDCGQELVQVRIGTQRSTATTLSSDPSPSTASRRKLIPKTNHHSNPAKRSLPPMHHLIFSIASCLLLITFVNCEILMMSEDEICQDEIISTRPVRIIADDADLFIGALVNVHEPGPSGFYGCGNITQSGVITFEALNWIAATINQEHGLINGKKVVESFIPGLKIGTLISS